MSLDIYQNQSIDQDDFSSFHLMEYLPNEVQDYILTYLDEDTLSNVSIANKNMYNLFFNSTVWSKMCKDSDMDPTIKGLKAYKFVQKNGFNPLKLKFPIKLDRKSLYFDAHSTAEITGIHNNNYRISIRDSRTGTHIPMRGLNMLANMVNIDQKTIYLDPIYVESLLTNNQNKDKNSNNIGEKNERKIPVHCLNSFFLECK